MHKLLLEWFRNDLIGVPRDEDGGGMSSFVVFSAVGFYHDPQGQAVYSIGSPMFEHVSVAIGNGKTFVIEARNASTENKYIQSGSLNGIEFNKILISHEAMINRGTDF